MNGEACIDYYGNLTQHHHRTPHLIEDTDIQLDYVRAMAAKVNFPSDFLPTKSYLIDNIIIFTPRFATLEHAPWDKCPYYQDDTYIWMYAINTALDTVSYAQAISNIADDTDFALSMGLSHQLLS